MDFVKKLINDIFEPENSVSTHSSMPSLVDDDSEDEDVSVSTIIINNEEYLIDDQFNLYHTKTHDNIGTFINEQLQLRPSYELTK